VTTGPTLTFSHYDWPAGREAMLRVGAADAPAVVVAPALFEEANRMRAFTLALMRALAGHGLASVLPDLPGQGESLWPTERATLSAWRAAFAAVVGVVAPVAVVAIRGGALVNDGARSHWHLAPIQGADLLRDLKRLIATGRPDIGDGPMRIAGNLVSPALLDELGGAGAGDGGRLRTVRLDTDPRPADRKVAGAPLWRLAEPGNDPPLAAMLAADIADWTASCAAS
jgi:hypothetical protein